MLVIDKRIRTEAIERYLSGERPYYIAERLGFSANILFKWIKAEGLPKMGRFGRISPKRHIWNDEAVVARHTAGETTKAIAESLGVKPWVVYNAYKRYGYSIENGTGSIGVQPERRMYDVNEDFFVDLNSELAAYWVGFLLADGSVRKDHATIRVGLQRRDRGHLEAFASDLGYTGGIRDYESPSGKKSSHIEINSVKLWQDVQEHGVVPNKSKFGHPTPEVSPDLRHHLIRGYLDGDGSVSKASINRKKAYFYFAGKESFLIAVRRWLHEDIGLKVDAAVTCQQRTTYALAYGGIRQVARMADYLYADATRFLPRKKERFDYWRRIV